MRCIVAGILWTLCFTLAAPTAAQELHTWTDEHGNIHVTDDPSRIPTRQGAESATSPRRPANWNIVDVPTPATPERGDPATAPAARGDGRRAELYDGLDERAWRKLYRDTDRDARYAEMCQNFSPGLKLGKLPAGMRVRVPANTCDLSGSNMTCISLLRSLLPEDPVSTKALSAPQMPCSEVERAMKDLLEEASRRRTALDTRASQHGVPLEWRTRR